MTRISLTIGIFVLVLSSVFGVFPTGALFPVQRALADDTGALTSGANAAVTSSAGDNNGFQTSPTNANALDGAFAVDTNTGTGVATDGCGTFPQSEDDQHTFYNFGISPTASSTIDGIQVETDAKVDSSSGSNLICVALSWDGGTSWTSAKASADINTTVHQDFYGSASDTWGRTWSVSDLSNSNFRVRLMMDPSASNSRDYSLDYLAVTAYYTPPLTGTIFSGHLYSDEGSTAINCSASSTVVTLKVNGAGSYSGTCSASTGAFSVGGLTLNSGDIVTAYINSSSVKAAEVVRASGTDASNLTLYQNRLVLRSDDGGDITNADIGQYDKDNSSALFFTSNSSNLSLDSGTKLVVPSSTTYAPGGGVTTDALELLGTYSGGSETLTLTGNGTSATCSAAAGTVQPLCINGGSFTPSSNTTVFQSSVTTGTYIPSITYYNLELNTSGNTFTPTSGTLQVGGNLSVSAGTFDLNSNDPSAIVVGSLTNAGTLQASDVSDFIFKGDWTNTGVFTNNGGTVVAGASTGSTVIITGMSTSTAAFYNFSATTSGVTLEFAHDQPTVFEGSVTITGSQGSPVNIQSDSPGSQWQLDLSGSASMDYVNVEDSGCVAGTESVDSGTHVYDQGNNGTCWQLLKRGTFTGPVEGGQGTGTPISGGTKSGDGSGAVDPVGVTPIGTGTTTTGGIEGSTVDAAP